MSQLSSWNICWMDGWLHSHLYSWSLIIHSNGVEIGQEHWRVKPTNHWQSPCDPFHSNSPSRPSAIFTTHDKKWWQVNPFSLALDAKQCSSKLWLAMCANGREHPSNDSENHHNCGLGLIYCWCLKIVCVCGRVLREIVVALRSCWSMQIRGGRGKTFPDRHC